MNRSLPKKAFKPSSFYYRHKYKVAVLYCSTTVLKVLYVLTERTVVCSTVSVVRRMYCILLQTRNELTMAINHNNTIARRTSPFQFPFSFTLDKLEPLTRYQVRLQAR